MTTSQKAALSLFISVVVMGIFSVLAFTGLYNFIETRFYNPSIANSISKEAAQDAQTIENYFDDLVGRFEAILNEEAVKQSFLPNQTASDILERSRLFSILLESEKGLHSARFVDGGGIRLHFSTSPADILSQTSSSIFYRNYDEVTPFIPYSQIAVPSANMSKITMDAQNDRIIFSFPFLDGLNAYRGTVVFSLSVRAVVDRFVMEGRIKIGEDVSLLSNPPGMVSGLPNYGKESILAVISKAWQDGTFKFVNLESSASSAKLALVSAKTKQGIIVGRVVNESLFTFPQPMKVILFATLFLTIFLIIFLFFNIQPDTMTVIQNRLKGLQLSLIRDYYERKGEIDWNHWYRELEQRREDVRFEIKRGITNKPAAMLEDIDSLIDKSWDEILASIGGRRETRLALDEDKLQNILGRMLAAAGNIPGMALTENKADGMPIITADPPATVDPTTAVQIAESPQDAEEVEEIEEIEEIEELTDADDLVEEFTGIESTAGVESVKAITDDDLEELEDVEELSPEQVTTQDIAMIDIMAANEMDELIANAEDIIPHKPKAKQAGTDKAAGNDINLGFEGGDIQVTAEELEELEELDELEELEELEESGSSFSIDAGPNHADIASKIEFSPSKKEEEALPDLNTVVEIVSPFSGLSSRFDDSKRAKSSTKDDSKDIKTSGRLEELNGDFSMSLVYQPFRNEIDSDPQELISVTGIIKQKDGINYVDSDVKNPDSESTKALDPGLKNLVDSVIGKK